MTRSLIEVAFQALAGNDPDQISAVFTEDAEWLSPPGNATVVALKLIDHTLKVTNHMVGRETIVRFWAEAFPACSLLTSTSPSARPTPTTSEGSWRRP
ncbi:hypothetical protein [Streptomyces sp. Ac-502]|uniref:hypothetical protein n=1 Tax=Streptomyces sp. Ac-502 TaxID=3342801 RepID=UPI003862959A